MRQNLEIVRGTSNAFTIHLTNPDDSPFALENGQALVFGLKRNRQDVDRVLLKTITDSVDGGYYLELTPEDTCDLDCGRYFYDVGLQHGDHVFYNVVEISELLIKPNVTKCGDCDAELQG